MRRIFPIIVLVAAVLQIGACGGRKAITYYQGSMPKYRMAQDGRYYAVDSAGRLIPYDFSYRGGQAADNDEEYVLPRNYQAQDAPYAPTYPLSMQQGYQVPTVPAYGIPAQPQVPMPATGEDNDTQYQPPLSPELMEREAQDNPAQAVVPMLPPGYQVPSRIHRLPPPPGTPDADNDYVLPPNYQTPDEPTGPDYPSYYDY